VNGKDKIFGFQLGQNMSRQLASRAKKGENRDLLFLQPLEIAKKVDEVLRPTYIGTHDHIQTNNFPEGESFSGKALNAMMAVTLKHSGVANLLTNPLMTDPTELVAMSKTNERILQSRARTNPDFKPGDDELYSIIGVAKGEKENKHNKKRDEDLEALKNSKGKSMYGQFLKEAFQVMPLFHGDGTEGHPGFNGQFFKLLPGARSQLGNTGGLEFWTVDPKNAGRYATGLYSVNWTRTALLNDGAALAAELKKVGRPSNAVAQVNLTDTRVLPDGTDPRADLERIIPATGEPLKNSIFMGMWSEKNLGHLNPNPTVGSDGKPEPFIPWSADFRNYFSIESPADMARVKANAKADMKVKLSDPVIAKNVDEEITNSILVGDKNRLVEEVSEFFKKTKVDGISFRVNTELMSSIDGLVNTFDTYRTNR
jgi:hypothetical protein